MTVTITADQQRGGYRLCCEQWLPAPLEVVFDFFSDTAGLERLTPRRLKFHVTTPPPIVMASGTVIDYRLRLYGIPLHWRSEIKDWEPPFRFTDVQLRGPYLYWEHLHTFRGTEGGTLVGDTVHYAVPGGDLVNRFFVRRDLQRIFAYRQRALKELFPARRTVGLKDSASG